MSRVVERHGKAGGLLWRLLLCFFVLAPLFSVPALADEDVGPNTPVLLYDEKTGDTCPGPNCDTVLARTAIDRVDICPGEGLARRMVPCIKDTMIAVVESILQPFSDWLAGTVSAACMLAVALLGTLLATGRTTAPARDTIVLLVKIGAVIMFTANFAGLFATVLDIVDSMLSIVGAYVMNGLSFISNSDCVQNSGDGTSLLIWYAVDCAIETLIGGIFSDVSITSGIVGFLVACLFSGTIGTMIAFICFYMIIQVLFAILKAFYIFLSSYIGLSLMIVVSPIFIPLILFSSTKTYFSKWLKLTLSFILQPLFLFAYLAMLLAAFDTVVYSGPHSLYHSIAGQAVDEPGFEIGEWLLDNDVYEEKDMTDVSVNIDSPKLKAKGMLPGAPVNAGPIDAQPALANGIGAAALMGVGPASPFIQVDTPVTAINWDALAAAARNPSVNDYLLSLLLSGLMALITGYIFMGLLDFIPMLSSSLAMASGGVGDKFGIDSAIGQIKPPGSDFISKLQPDLKKKPT